MEKKCLSTGPLQPSCFPQPCLWCGDLRDKPASPLQRCRPGLWAQGPQCQSTGYAPLGPGMGVWAEDVTMMMPVLTWDAL